MKTGWALEAEDPERKLDPDISYLCGPPGGPNPASGNGAHCVSPAGDSDLWGFIAAFCLETIFIFIPPELHRAERSESPPLATWQAHAFLFPMTDALKFTECPTEVILNTEGTHTTSITVLLHGRKP